MGDCQTGGTIPGRHKDPCHCPASSCCRSIFGDRSALTNKVRRNTLLRSPLPMSQTPQRKNLKMKRRNVLPKQIVRSALILASCLLTTVAYMTASDQPANASSGSAIQQPGIVVDVVTRPNHVAVDHAAQISVSHAQIAARQASPAVQAVDKRRDVDVAVALARVNQHVSEQSEEIEATIARYPTAFSILPFGGPMFIISPRFPWGESIPIPQVTVPR